MKPEDIIKFIFEHEQVDYELRAYKSRKGKLVQARQRSMYLVKHFFPLMTWDEVGSLFGQKHDGAIHAYNKVSSYIATEKMYSREIANYITKIRLRINKATKLKVNCTSATLKMVNRRAILKKTSLGYVITLKRLNGKKIEEATLNLSYEAMEGINEAYNILK